MNEQIIKEIAQNLNIKEPQVSKTLKLLEEGNTIPFIARYRKEVTGNLDEEQIRKISEVYEYGQNLLKRKEDVIRLIDEKGLLTDELKVKIMQATKLVEVEDLYRPYKEKKKTKATEAIKNGLEPLAKLIMSYPKEINFDKFLNENVKTKEDAIEGASYIIAEWTSDNASYRKYIRRYMYNNGKLVTKLKKNAEDENKTYEMYYDFTEPLKYAKAYRIMAINRAEKEKVITVNLDVDDEHIINYLKEKIIKKESPYNYIIENAIKDSYKRLIKPSVEREIRSEITEKAEDEATKNFSLNLENLLMQPPMKGKMVLGFDPAYRTGCKLAVVDETGKMLDISVIYPHEPKCEKEKSKKILLDLIKKYKIDIIAIGNGTASRESEAFVADTIKEADHKVEYILVSEAGASVYSASKLAIEEYPDLHVEQRSAISIARRLQDPLSELVKIDPESIGVGMYQHDVAPKKLSDSLGFVVTKSVNNVGVNVNTASSSLLKYVSGLTKTNINKILKYRSDHGKFQNRDELKKLLTPKTYTQSIGFLRIPEGTNILDATSIHPESYDITLNLLKLLNLDIKNIGTEEFNKKLDIDIAEYAKKLNTDVYTLEDIVKSLQKPNRDPRDDMPKPLLKSDVLHLEDLKPGMKLQGTVRNVTPFGAFIDIGIKNDGLAHISKLTNKYIKHPSEVVSVGDIVDCYVDEIYPEKHKVSLSLIKPEDCQ
ncbi:MAG TPA: RNA-binding transcriptional accessory protein [Candidatus Coprosoma intestinipullorum]|uniref:RNA-binding transcriptional accessory protein n=1 Tax=Candidatus Coprosoma intestinipullorum TaxID=2840752 RepID=A0A9D0ZR85_9FIRM|nr:RNA-binding transcriptional accessory protein [Candidatus Coprosoma intestinipullorum]